MNKPTLTAARCWRAIVARDAAADGRFFYAVKTTGVYCRPHCASRLPNRENVVFFPTGSAAERAGFRPCKRCRPHHELSRTSETVVKVCRLIAAAEEPPPLRELAAAVNLSPFHLHRLFKSTIGATPKQYALALRNRRLQSGLSKHPTVTQAIVQSGYRSPSRVYSQPQSLLGMSPREFQRGGIGMRIRTAVVDSPLGWLLVAATDRGICLIELADEPTELRNRLSARFPHAEFQNSDATLTRWVRQIVRFLKRPAGHLQLPLDIQGTAFQQRVWQALQTIPAGETATYTEIAEQIGRPEAVRAVAAAIAANPAAVAIPCHRVIGKSGKLCGYRWGIERKQSLINEERKLKR